MSQIYEIIIFTASIPEYADKVINFIDPNKEIVDFRLFRDKCTYYQGNFIKDLDRLNRPKEKMIIIDNSLNSFVWHTPNALLIESYFDSVNDTALADMSNFLRFINELNDVRIASEWKHKYDNEDNFEYINKIGLVETFFQNTKNKEFAFKKLSSLHLKTPEKKEDFNEKNGSNPTISSKKKSNINLTLLELDEMKLFLQKNSENVFSKFLEKQKFEKISLKGHKRCITSLEIDQNNAAKIVTTGKDSAILLWDIEKQQKTLFCKGKENPFEHYDEILCSSLHQDGRLLVTAGKDQMIKLWDLRQKHIIDTFKGHRGSIQGIKFALKGQTFASISVDKTLKVWDAGERAFIDTFYGHKNEINCIDAMKEQDFLTGGYDKQSIFWNIEAGSQLLFTPVHDYSIDCVLALNENNYISGSQDGNIVFWDLKKRKYQQKIENVHNKNWITALGGNYNSDLICSGSYDGFINFFGVEGEIKKLFSVECEGVINNLKFSNEYNLLVASVGDEHRLGRWMTAKCNPHLEIFKIN